MTSEIALPPQKTSVQERRRGLALLFISLLSLGMGQSLFFAIFPPVARNMGLNEIQVSAIFSLSGILWVIMSPVWGRYSDYWGRKPVILIGLSGFSLSTLGFGMLVYMGLNALLPLMVIFVLMILSRAIFGGLGSGAPSAAQAYIADRTTRAQRTRGVAAIGAAFGAGTVIGPGFAAVLSQIHVLVPFFALGCMAACGAIAILIYLPERQQPARKKGDNKVDLKASDKRIRIFLFMGVVLSVIQAITLQVAAFFIMDELATDIQATTEIVGIGMMAMAVMTLIVQLIIIPFANLSVRALLLSGIVTMGCGIALLLVPVSFMSFVLAMAFLGLGMGAVRPGMIAAASLSVREDEQGSIAGFMSSTAAVGVIFLPLLIMPLYNVHHGLPYYFALGLAGLLLILAYRLKSEKLDMPVDSGEVHEKTMSTPQKL